ncbi:MAG: hypothetical protein FWH08_00150 [Oscillospiraceae bacterium]|nr:hypothetical protein [Oscillospiraceae bacterium]
MSNIEWLWFKDFGFDPYALSVPEKLSKHGYALILNRMEAGKAQAAELCIHDVLIQNAKPNIVIICPEYLIKSWYTSLLWDMGAEFKYFGVGEKSLNLFSETISNCCLVTVESLARDGENSLLATAENMNHVWDLMVIDIPISCPEAFHIKTYLDAVKTKSKKVLINAHMTEEYSRPDDFDRKYEALSELVKNLLYVGDKKTKKFRFPDFAAKDADQVVIAGRNMSGNYNVKTIDYSIDDGLIAKAKRIDGARSDIPLYKYGGNIFEEYSFEERKIYLNEKYSEKQLNALITADGKLKAFLKELSVLFSNPKNRVVVYCMTPNTVNYIGKVLRTRYGEKNVVCVYDGNASDSEFIIGEFSGSPDNEPRVIITDDTAGNKFISVGEVTHIINYEYPENAAILEQRYTRGGRKQGNPVFYIFCDDKYRYDGRILLKIVLANLNKAFCGRIPDKCLLFSINNIEEHITALILDLKFTCENTAGGGASLETVENFRVEYDIPEADTAAKTNEISEMMLKRLAVMFDIGYILEQSEIEGEQLFAEVTKKIEAFRSQRVYLDKRTVIRVADEKTAPLPHVESIEPPAEVQKAAQFAEKLTGDSGDYLFIKKETGQLSDNLKFSALISIWKHYKYEMKIPRSYKEFIKLYNKGGI